MGWEVEWVVGDRKEEGEECMIPNVRLSSGFERGAGVQLLCFIYQPRCARLRDGFCERSLSWEVKKDGKQRSLGV